MNLQSMRALAAGSLICLFGLPLAASPNQGKIAGVVLDPGGTPQMGATVLISPEELLSISPVELLTNGRGSFLVATLPAGLYSVKVTLAGYLPAMEQHILVQGNHTTPLEIVLGSVFSSFEQLRRQPGERVSQDDWVWVLRTSAATRSVLQLDDAGLAGGEGAQRHANRALVEVTSGDDHPGSIASESDAPATAFVYDMGIGAQQQLLVAGQISYDGIYTTGGFASEWLPSGKPGTGPRTILVMRESQLGPYGPVFRGMRVSSDDQLALSDRVSVRYGAEYIVAGFAGTATALRPHGEVAIQLSQNWRASATIAKQPFEDDFASGDTLDSTLEALDAFPTLMVRNNQPVFENDLHEEIAVERALGRSAGFAAAAFHDDAAHTAVIGHGAALASDFVQGSLSQTFAYDGGGWSSNGVRAAYWRKLTNNVSTTVVYAYAGALEPTGDQTAAGEPLRELLARRYVQSVAGRVSATVPRFGTKLTTSYKWLSGAVVSQQDAYGEAMYHLDPYLSLELCQRLPGLLSGHMEVHAQAGNLFAQGYRPIETPEGNVILVPSYRYLRGGLSVQF